MADIAFRHYEAAPFYNTTAPVDPAQFYDDETNSDLFDAPLSQAWFSFPVRPASQEPSSSSKLPARLQPSLPLGNHGESTSRSHTRSFNSTSSLPPFTFNPSTPKDQSAQIPRPVLQSAVSAPSTPARAGRHRRTASEFIGGNGRPGPAGQRNGSPDKQWTGHSTQPTILPFGSLPSRLDHRHRRTESLSSQSTSQVDPPISLSNPDLSETPTQLSTRVPREDVSTPIASTPITTPILRQGDFHYEPRPSPSRARVGFSDRLEFIPRPLSTISSESGSSLSTIRGHSISGSISSVLCAVPGSPLSKQATNTYDTVTLTGLQPLRARSTSPGLGVAQDMPVTTSMFNIPQRPTSAGPSVDCSRLAGSPQYLQEETQPESSNSASSSNQLRKHRKVVPWAALLGRKHKAAETNPNPPTLMSSPPVADDVFCSNEPITADHFDLSENFDEDPTSIIISPPHLDFTPHNTPPLTPLDGQRLDGETIKKTVAPMIDLDEALGPFNTSSDCQDFQDFKGRKYPDSRRSMHSGTVTSGFFAAGVHRRADSAPSHVPATFDAINFREHNNSTPSFKRSQMEDVFEEDESDVNPSLYGSTAQSIASKECLKMDLPTSISEDKPTTEDTARPITRRLRVSASLNGQQFRYTQSDLDSVEILDGTDTPQIGNDCSRLGSNIPMEASSDAHIMKGAYRAGSDVSSIASRPQFVPEARFGSSVSSTQCGCEDDVPREARRNTATSLGPDIRRFNTHTFGEHGSDLRYSVDDVPSLMSSRSTMTNPAHVRAPSTSSRGFAPRSTSSSLSLSSAMDRRRKRSSIGSLGQLMKAPFTDRNHQPVDAGKRWQTPMAAKDIKSPNKPSRLSRLFRFWKAKESSS